MTKIMNAVVKNTPSDVKSGYVVARRDDYTAELWYYGKYDTEKQAYDIALELENGVVVEYDEQSTNN